MGIGSDREEGKSFMPVLVLNSSLQPLSVIPERRLIVLLSKQKVTFVDESVRQLIEESIQARRLELERPVIVQLLANIRVPRMVLQPTRANILLRDDETCQYCGRRSRDLTLDHVLPRSRGGQSKRQSLAQGSEYAPVASASPTHTGVRRVFPVALPEIARGLRGIPHERTGGSVLSKR